MQPNAKWKPKYELFDIVADPFAGQARIRATVTIAGQVRGADYVELKYFGPAGKK